MSTRANRKRPSRRGQKGPSGRSRAMNYEAWMSPSDRTEFLTLVAHFGPQLVGCRERDFWLGKIRAAEDEKARYLKEDFNLPTIREEGPETAWEQDDFPNGTSKGPKLMEIDASKEHAAQSANPDAIGIALKAIDMQLDELDPPPDTKPLNPASFPSVDDYGDAFSAQVEAICDFLPPIDDKLMRHLPAYNFKGELQALVHWWAPRLVEVSRLGEEDLAEFWRLFNQVLDLWKQIPFFDDNGQRFPVEFRREASTFFCPLSLAFMLKGLQTLAERLLKAVAQGKPQALALDPSRAGTPWRNDFDLEFHREYLTEAHTRAFRPGGKRDYYRHRRWTSVADHLIDKVAHPESHCECLLTADCHGFSCFSPCSCFSLF
ncbi:hypothetical protein MD484_g8156, partial [Candolleomyces efflorescens]